MKNKLNFFHDLQGLQVYWNTEGFEELESIDFLQLGKDACTKVMAVSGRKKYEYEYPVAITRIGYEISVVYEKIPAQCEDLLGWDSIITGRLAIRIGDDLKPNELEWYPDADQKLLESYSLKKNEDWKFVENVDEENESYVERSGRLVRRPERPDQARSRKILLWKYEKCFLTDCSVGECLEAAHILPVKENGSETLNNMILLRSDIHRLLDAHLISIKMGEDGSSIEVRADKSVLDYVRPLFSSRITGNKEMWKSRTVWIEKRTGFVEKKGMRRHEDFLSWSV